MKYKTDIVVEFLNDEGDKKEIRFNDVTVTGAHQHTLDRYMDFADMIRCRDDQYEGYEMGPVYYHNMTRV